VSATNYTVVQSDVPLVCPLGDEGEIVLASNKMLRLMDDVRRVASGSDAVLITGETGSGKELIARAVHQASLRCSKPWVDINCGALPDNLVESELFGYEKGAFSGAETSKPGLFELANHGTLFLDEVGELEPRLQVKLLRVLDGVPYYRLGGTKKVDVDVRIVAATNQPLERQIESGYFRRDLFHRLSHFQLRVPPLRERPEDVVALAEYFLRRQEPVKTLTSAAIEVLQSYAWPGNVRELQNVIRQAASAATGEEIQAQHLQALRTSMPGATIRAPGTPDLDAMEREAIFGMLTRTGGRKTLAAEQLGISRRTLSRKLKLYQAQAPDPAQLSDRCILSPFAYRCPLRVPVWLRNASGGKTRVSSENLTLGGIGVSGLDDALAYSGRLQIEFTLPGRSLPATMEGEIAWADVSGAAGLRFVHVPSSVQMDIAYWLKQQKLEMQ